MSAKTESQPTHHPVRTALRIARVSSPQLTNLGTSLTSLLMVPLLEVLMMVAVSASLGAGDLVAVAYAGILISYGLSIIAGTVEQVCRDRGQNVLQDVLLYRWFYPPYWIGKISVSLVLGAVIAVGASLAVFLLDVNHSGSALSGVVLLIPVVGIAGALTSVAIALLSVPLRDPYLVSNILSGIIPLLAGILVPVSQYPILLADLAHLFPFTAAVEAMRNWGRGSGWGAGLPMIGQELLVALAWFVLGLASSFLTSHALRDGRKEEIF